MKSVEEVRALVEKYKAERLPIKEAVWNTARACVGWPYVFGAEGRPAKKDGMDVLSFDCQGFVEWCLLNFGVDIRAAGATSQWNKRKIWAAKGLVKDGIPKDQLVCLYYRDAKDSTKMAHVGFGFNGQTCECSVGVQYFEQMKPKWTHWALPKGVEDNFDPDKVIRPTLRKGSRGAYVTLLQTALMQKGYALPKYGADGDYGAETAAAVKQLQQDAGLKADGICGPKTWEALDGTERRTMYCVSVPHLTRAQADELAGKYAGAVMTEETGMEGK